MTKGAAMKEAELTGRPVMFRDPGPRGDHGMVYPCGCIVVAVGFTRETRTDYCQRCLQKRRQPV